MGKNIDGMVQHAVIWGLSKLAFLNHEGFKINEDVGLTNDQKEQSLLHIRWNVIDLIKFIYPFIDVIKKDYAVYNEVTEWVEEVIKKTPHLEELCRECICSYCKSQIN